MTVQPSTSSSTPLQVDEMAMRKVFQKKKLTGPDGLRATLLAMPALPEDIKSQVKTMKQES